MDLGYCNAVICFACFMMVGGLFGVFICVVVFEFCFGCCFVGCVGLVWCLLWCLLVVV